MAFTDVFIKKPVLAIVVNLLLLLAGLVALSALVIRQYPNIQSTAITVTTSFPGASAEMMAGFITTPLEDALGQIENLDYMASSNTEGKSQIIIYLSLDADQTESLTQAQAQISQVMYQFPEGTQNPVVELTDATASPIIYIAFKSDRMSPEEVSDYLIRFIQPQLQSVEGVQSATVLGGREYAMRINLDPKRMAAYNVTPSDVKTALISQNVITPAGRIEAPYQEYNIVAKTDMETERQFNQLLVADKEGAFVRIKDIGKAFLGAKSNRIYANIDGEQTISIGIYAFSQANPLQISKEINALIPRLQQELPSGMIAEIVYDSSLFIEESLEEIQNTFIEAVIFVIIVILLFLGSFRAVIIPIITIPLSIIGVGLVMLMLGYSINTITLLAWVLAIGLVVDDAIVVLENVHRHIQLGKTPMEAALVGTREISFAVIAMTITLAAVYAPIGFTPGLTGKMFREFAFTLSAAVIVSGFIALTLSPMMSAKLLSHSSSKFSDLLDKIFNRITAGYESCLHFVLKIRILIVLLTAAILAIGFYYLFLLPSELAPIEDQGVINTYNEGPASANIKYMVEYSDQMDPIIKKFPDIETSIIVSGIPFGVNSGISRLRLTDWGKRDKTAMQLSSEVTPLFASITGIDVFTYPPPPLPGSGNLPLEFVLKTTGENSIERLNEASKKIMAAAKEFPGIEQMNTDLKIDKPQITLKVNRELAYESGVQISEVSEALNLMFGEPMSYQFIMNQRSYYIIPELTRNYEYKNDPNSINGIYVRASENKLIPLGNIIEIEKSVEPKSINHFQQLPSVTLSGTMAPRHTIGEAIEFLNNYVDNNLPSDIYVDYAGQSRQFIESGNEMVKAFILALIFIFLVLSAQFESFRAPIIVIMTVPLSITGALVALYYFGGTLNIYTQIGLITLVGLISKHGILIVEFANQIRDSEKLDNYSAVIKASSVRLRPILMTTAAMVLGALPLAVATGAGAVARSQLGIMIVFGMLVGTFFTLFVIPVFYTLIARRVVIPNDQQ